jgi:integrase/recombinase XerC
MKKLFHWLARYLKSLQRENASPYTIKNYGTDIRQFLDYCVEQDVRSLEDLTRDFVRQYMAELMETGYARASIARRVFELRAFGDYLLQKNVWGQNIFRRIHAPRVRKRLPRYLTVDEVGRLLAVPPSSSPKGLRDRAILETLYASGVRVSELTGLNLASVDLHTGEVRVIGKGDKERITLLGRPAIAALQDYIQKGRPDQVGKRPTNALFLNRFGDRLSVRSVDEIVRKAGEAAGITQNVTPHLLRHTFATHLLDGGADLRVVQELLGHKNLVTTQIYAHVTQRRAKEIYLQAHPRSDSSETNH